MNFSKFRDDQLSENQRLDVYKNYNFNELSLDDLVKMIETMQEQKRDFRDLVDNFNKLNDKEFFKCYKTFYKWDNKKLETLDDSPFLEILFMFKPESITDGCINIMYEKRSDVFKKIKSEFTKEILINDYNAYCKAYRKTFNEVSKILLNEKNNKKKRIEQLEKEIADADKIIHGNF